MDEEQRSRGKAKRPSHGRAVRVWAAREMEGRQSMAKLSGSAAARRPTRLDEKHEDQVGASARWPGAGRGGAADHTLGHIGWKGTAMAAPMHGKLAGLSGSSPPRGGPRGAVWR